MCRLCTKHAQPARLQGISKKNCFLTVLTHRCLTLDKLPISGGSVSKLLVWRSRRVRFVRWPISGGSSEILFSLTSLWSVGCEAVNHDQQCDV